MLKTDKLATAATAKPELTAANAAGRFILVPGSEYGCEDPKVAGWTGKICKVVGQIIHVQFQDDKGYWQLAYANKKFKILT